MRLARQRWELYFDITTHNIFIWLQAQRGALFSSILTPVVLKDMPGKVDQLYSCWCPGSFRHEVNSNHGIVYMRTLVPEAGISGRNK